MMNANRSATHKFLKHALSRHSESWVLKFPFKQYGTHKDQSHIALCYCRRLRSRLLLNQNIVKSKSRAVNCVLYQKRGVQTIKPLVILKVESRCFHTTGQRHAVPPLLWVILSPLYKIAAALTGRRLRNWLKVQPPELQKKYYRYITACFATVLSVLAGLATYYYESHLQETPISGRRRFITLNKEQCSKIADYELESFNEQFKNCTLPATHPYYQIVVEIGMKLVRANKDVPGMTDQQWVVHVVDNPEKNAFVLPNGHIFVYTGMLKFCENKDQLAVILGHEMSHALLMHACKLTICFSYGEQEKAEQLSYTQFLDKAVIVLMTALWTFMPNDGVAVVFQWYCEKLKKVHLDMPYSRSLEKEADNVGLQLAAKACYDIREGTVLWGRMSVSDDLMGKEKVPEWLSTHPTHANRVKNINQLIPKNLELRENCNCPRLPEQDPRVKIQHLRNQMDNVLIARATKANLQRIEKVNQDKLNLPSLVESVKLHPNRK